MIHGTALRFAISIGLIPAIPATMIPAPATGLILRPIPAPICAMEPSSIMPYPKSAACGVTAPLKARAAALPEPEITANKNGPKAAPI